MLYFKEMPLLMMHLMNKIDVLLISGRVVGDVGGVPLDDAEAERDEETGAQIGVVASEFATHCSLTESI